MLKAHRLYYDEREILLLDSGYDCSLYSTPHWVDSELVCEREKTGMKYANSIVCNPSEDSPFSSVLDVIM